MKTTSSESEPKSKFTLDTLQSELVPWQSHNFPNRPYWQPLLGIFEELGELENATSPEEILDACADVVVFMCDFCNARGYHLKDILVEYDGAFIPSRIIVDVGDLSHSILKQAQKIRVSENHIRQEKIALRNIFVYVAQITRQLGREIVEVTEKTWSEVKMRDWKRDAVNAGRVNTSKRK